MLMLTSLQISARHILPESLQPYKICFRLWFGILEVTYYVLYGFSLYSKCQDHTKEVS